MPRHAILLVCLLIGTALPAAAQIGGPGGAPADPGPPQIRFTGRVIADSTRQPDEIIEVRLEGAGGARIAFAYTETNGAFQFRPVVLEPGGAYFVVVDYEGHLPFRERLDHLTDIYSGGQLVIFLESDDDDEANSGAVEEVVDLSQLEAEIPQEAYDEYERAMEEIGQGLYLSAIPRLESVVEIAPDFYEAYNSLGGQYVRVHRYRDAQAALERALELSPASTPPLVNLGFLHYQEGQVLKEAGDSGATESFRRAVEALDRAIRNDPIEATAHYYLGAALYELDELARAEAMLELALELDAEAHDARLVLINLFARQSRFEDALDELTTYLAANPDSPMRGSLEQLQARIESNIDFLRQQEED